MSTFVVSENHINAILSYLHQKSINVDSYPIIFRDSGKVLSFSDKEDLQEMVNILVKENDRSVNHRYGSNDMTEYTFDFIDNYSFHADNDCDSGVSIRNPIQIIKLCYCYDYQSCENDDYESSTAFKLIQCIVNNIVRDIDGYDSAQWSI